MLTTEQIDIGKRIRAGLTAAEAAHPDCPHVASLHRRLGRLLKAFRSQMSDADFVALGGGTGKDDEEGED